MNLTQTCELGSTSATSAATSSVLRRSRDLGHVGPVAAVAARLHLPAADHVNESDSELQRSTLNL